METHSYKLINLNRLEQLVCEQAIVKMFSIFFILVKQFVRVYTMVYYSIFHEGKLHVSKDVFEFLGDCWDIKGEDDGESALITHSRDCDATFLKSKTTRMYLNQKSNQITPSDNPSATRHNSGGGTSGARKFAPHIMKKN